MLRLLDHLEEVIITVLIAAATVIIFVAVVHRYGLSLTIGWARWGAANEIAWLDQGGKSAFKALKSIDLSWTQELCIYMFVWMAKFGAAYGVRTGIHVGVDLIVNLLSPAERKPVVLFGLMCGAFFTALVGTFGALFVAELAQTDQVSADLELPMWVVYLAVPLGSFLMSFRFLQVAWSFHLTGELPHHDHGHVDGLEDAPAAADVARKEA